MRRPGARHHADSLTSERVMLNNGFDYRTTPPTDMPCTRSTIPLARLLMLGRVNEWFRGLPAFAFFYAEVLGRDGRPGPERYGLTIDAKARPPASIQPRVAVRAEVNPVRHTVEGEGANRGLRGFFAREAVYVYGDYLLCHARDGMASLAALIP